MDCLGMVRSLELAGPHSRVPIVLPGGFFFPFVSDLGPVSNAMHVVIINCVPFLLWIAYELNRPIWKQGTKHLSAYEKLFVYMHKARVVESLNEESAPSTQQPHCFRAEGEK